MRLLPAMAGVAVGPGTSFVDSSAGNVEEEQALFSMPDGRECLTFLQASGTMTLTCDWFRHKPYYKIENLTEEPVSLKAYDVSDYLYLVPAMTVDVLPGTSHIMASSRGVKEEQAVFALSDGRIYKGRNLEPFDTVTLRIEDFSHDPFYKIENLTKETVTLRTYATSDFVYLIPSMVIEVSPGTSFVYASSGQVLEEQASFTTQDDRVFSGFNVKAFQTIVLKQEFFT